MVVVDVVGGAADVVVVDVGGGGGGAWHDSVSETTTPWTGTWMLDSGVPGETSTVKVKVCPPTIVTWTVQVSASAAGASDSHTAAKPPSSRAASRASTFRGSNARRSTINFPPPLSTSLLPLRYPDASRDIRMERSETRFPRSEIRQVQPDPELPDERGPATLRSSYA